MRLFLAILTLKVSNSLSVEGGAGVSQSVLDALFDEVRCESLSRLAACIVNFSIYEKALSVC